MNTPKRLKPTDQQRDLRYLECENRSLQQRLVDEFAQAALIALYSNADITSEVAERCQFDEFKAAAYVARMCFNQADAMLAERQRRIDAKDGNGEPLDKPVERDTQMRQPMNDTPSFGDECVSGNP